MISIERKEKLKKEALEILIKNRRSKNGFQYTVPSPTSYPYQWLWDSCFHAIILSHFSPEDAKKELRSLISHQFQNGMIPHIIYWEKQDHVIDIEWGKDGTSSITQPPLIAQAVWAIYRKDSDKSFLEEMFPPLYHFYNYLLTERDPRGNSLAGILNPDESGEDNSPRFDDLLGLGPNQTLAENFQQRLELVKELQDCNFDAPFCMKKNFWVKDVPFNSILVKNLDILSKIAAEIGNKEESLVFSEKKLKVEQAMRDKMLEDGLFWSTQGENYTKIKIKTWAIFAPLFAGILSVDEVHRLVNDYLFNPQEFGARFLTPSVSQGEESFDPKGFWRGPSWVAINWFIHQGLLHYGLKVEAGRVLNDTLALIDQSGFREYYHPHTGEGLGAKDFTWGALVIDMLDNHSV